MLDVLFTVLSVLFAALSVLLLQNKQNSRSTRPLRFEELTRCGRFWLCVEILLATIFRRGSPAVLVDSFGESATKHSETLRGVEYLPKSPVKGRPHAKYAAHRNAMCDYLTQVSAYTGLTEVAYQPSKRDIKRGVYHFRCEVHSLRDMAPYETAEKVGDFSIPTERGKLPNFFGSHIDSEHYQDMNAVLGEAPMTHVCFAVAPEKAALDDGEVDYHFEGNEIKMKVQSASMPYEHELWDYSGDRVAVPASRAYAKSISWIFGFLPLFIVYRILAHTADDGIHVIVHLVPERVITASWRDVIPLKRANVMHRGWKNTWTVIKRGLEVSISKQGYRLSAELPIQAIDTLRSRLNMGKVFSATGNKTIEFFIEKLKATIPQVKIDDPRIYLILEYLEDTQPVNAFGLGKFLPVPRVFGYTSVSTLPDLPDEVGVTKGRFLTWGGREVVTPLFGALAPAILQSDKANNCRTAYTLRVERATGPTLPGVFKWRPENMTAMDRKFKAKIQSFRAEYIQTLGGYVGKLEPFGLDEVYEKLHRPSQKAKWEQVMVEGVEAVDRYFLKQEPTLKAGKDRGITASTSRHAYELARFAYPWMEAMQRNVHWYSLGKTPKKVAEDLAAKAVRALFLTTGDIKEQEASYNPDVWELIYALARQAFPDHREQVVFLIHRVARLFVKNHGETYSKEFVNPSGHYMTALLNSIVTGMLSFVAARFGCSIEDAWQRILEITGDDNVLKEIPLATLVKVSAHLGFTVTGTMCRPGEPVEYLSRYYTGLFEGSPLSVPDVPRALSKLTITFKSPDLQQDCDLLQEKLSAAIRLNGGGENTVTLYARHTLTLLGLTYQEEGVDNDQQLEKRWNAQFSEDTGYPCPPEDESYRFEDLLWPQLMLPEVRMGIMAAEDIADYAQAALNVYTKTKAPFILEDGEDRPLIESKVQVVENPDFAMWENVLGLHSLKNSEVKVDDPRIPDLAQWKTEPQKGKSTKVPKTVHKGGPSDKKAPKKGDPNKKDPPAKKGGAGQAPKTAKSGVKPFVLPTKAQVVVGFPTIGKTTVAMSDATYVDCDQKYYPSRKANVAHIRQVVASGRIALINDISLQKEIENEFATAVVMPDYDAAEAYRRVTKRGDKSDFAQRLRDNYVEWGTHWWTIGRNVSVAHTLADALKLNPKKKNKKQKTNKNERKNVHEKKEEKKSEAQSGDTEKLPKADNGKSAKEPGAASERPGSSSNAQGSKKGKRPKRKAERSGDPQPVVEDAD